MIPTTRVRVRVVRRSDGLYHWTLERRGWIFWHLAASGCDDTMDGALDMTTAHLNQELAKS